MVAEYRASVSTQDRARAAQKTTPFLSKSGKARNIGMDGKTYKNVASACAAILSVSDVSRHSHMKARIEISGSDAISPPMLGFRRLTSETIIIMMPDRAALMMR